MSKLCLFVVIYEEDINVYILRKLQINTSYERVLFYICLHTILRMVKYVNHSRYITKNSVLLTYLKIQQYVMWTFTKKHF